MVISILDIPPEVLQQVTLFATLGSPLGPPKELINCMLTCRTFNEILSPKNAGELHHFVFAQKFDILGPVYRLSSAVVREHAPLEMQRRFRAIQIFKGRLIYHPELTEALWIAYIMVEDSDTSQKNVKQLLRAQLPSFLDLYLRHRLYEGAEENNGWPIVTEQNSLAIALSWTLASQMAISSEDVDAGGKMMQLLQPIAFAAFRYSIFHTSASSFNFGPDSQTNSRLNAEDGPYPISMLPVREISYFGTVQRKARAPSAALFSILLYFARTEKNLRLSGQKVPLHIKCQTREEANAIGWSGPCIDDYIHCYHHCRTRFADFPGIDIGILSSAIANSPDSILCQPSGYKLGTLSGQWQGSTHYPDFDALPPSDDLPISIDTSSCSWKPCYVTLEEHFCFDEAAVVPHDGSENGARNAWLPTDLVATATTDGMHFSDESDTFSTTYETFQQGYTNLRGRKVVDVIITGKTENQYLAAWGGPKMILGRIRLHDGLMVIVRYNHPLDPDEEPKRVLQGYVTSSQNLVGRFTHDRLNDTRHYYEGLFSLSKNNTGITSRFPRS